MAAIVQQSARHWKESAIERSEAITDAWEVCKAYLGRAAEVVLFLCLILSLVEVLPGVHAPLWFVDMVIGVQAVMLDIGGFALASLADHARQHGNEQAASRAERTGKILIGIVILTVALLVGGVIIPAIRPYTNDAELVLLLVRVIMTVIYGHVLHSLRRVSSLAVTSAQPIAAAAPIDYEAIARQLLPLVVAPIQDLRSEMTGQIERLSEQVVSLQSVQSVQDSEPESEQFGNQEETTEETDIVHLEDYRSEQSGNTDSLPTVNEKAITRKLKPLTKKAPDSGRKNARTTAVRVLKKFPDIGPSELAQRAQISKSYASKIIAEREG